MNTNTLNSHGFRPVPRTGVIFVTTEAKTHGYFQGSQDWSNLGQGAPETGELPGSPPRVSSIDIRSEDYEYAPVDGLVELKDAVAQLYNERYRKGMKSQYSAENVAISSGGRLALTRVVSTLGRTNLGHFLPDYTAYEELLDSFGTFVPIPIPLDIKNNYQFTSKELEKEILSRGLSAVLLSNPGNPTGKLIRNGELSNWIATARTLSCSLILDEFYSHYYFEDDKLSVSGAEFVEDVNEDHTIILDGLTKNWRYPGWRICWTLGPKKVIEGIASAGSFLDGGCSRPMQRAAIPLLAKEHADTEAKAIKETFRKKRQFMLEELHKLNIRVPAGPDGGFYCFADLTHLKEDYNSGMKFFRRALEHGVIVVPGVFFDVNPGQRRPDRPSRFLSHIRLSFGPDLKEISRGLEKIKSLIEE